MLNIDENTYLSIYGLSPVVRSSLQKDFDEINKKIQEIQHKYKDLNEVERLKHLISLIDELREPFSGDLFGKFFDDLKEKSINRIIDIMLFGEIETDINDHENKLLCEKIISFLSGIISILEKFEIRDFLDIFELQTNLEFKLTKKFKEDGVEEYLYTENSWEDKKTYIGLIIRSIVDEKVNEKFIEDFSLCQDSENFSMSEDLRRLILNNIMIFVENCKNTITRISLKSKDEVFLEPENKDENHENRSFKENKNRNIDKLVRTGIEPYSIGI